MASIARAQSRQNVPVRSLFNHLFTDVRLALIWLPIRVWLGVQWIDAGKHKLDNPAWTDTGLALKGYWTNAVSMEGARPPIAYDWYRSFIQYLLDTESYTWFAKLVTYGELLVGLGLIVGALVGLTAFFGALMNFNYMMAGSASTNPMLFVVALGLIAAWRVAGLVGVDIVIFKRQQLITLLKRLRGKDAVSARS